MLTSSSDIGPEIKEPLQGSGSENAGPNSRAGARRAVKPQRPGFAARLVYSCDSPARPSQA